MVGSGLFLSGMMGRLMLGGNHPFASSLPISPKDHEHRCMQDRHQKILHKKYLDKDWSLVLVIVSIYHIMIVLFAVVIGLVVDVDIGKRREDAMMGLQARSTLTTTTED